MTFHVEQPALLPLTRFMAVIQPIRQQPGQGNSHTQ